MEFERDQRLPIPQSSLQGLPAELFKPILAQAVRVRSMKRALKLRLVCKSFNAELPEILYSYIEHKHSDLHHDAVWFVENLRRMQFMSPYIEKRLNILIGRSVDYRQGSTLRLQNRLADALAADDENPNKAGDYFHFLSKWIVIHHDSYRAELLLKEDFRHWTNTEGSNDDRPFELHLVMAAMVTGKPLLARKIATQDEAVVHALVDNERTAFGLAFDVVMRTQSMDILSLAFEKARGRMDSYDFYLYFSRLLCAAIKAGAVARVQTVLDLEWSSFCSTRAEYICCLKLQLRDASREEIFKLIMDKIMAISPLDRSPYTIMLDDPHNHNTKLLDTDEGVGAAVEYVSNSISTIERPSKEHLDIFLSWACSRGKERVALRLLEHGAQVRTSDLGSAARRGDTAMVKLLLHHGAHRDVLEVRRALCWAATKGFADIVDLLLDAGADIKDKLTKPKRRTKAGVRVDSDSDSDSDFGCDQDEWPQSYTPGCRCSDSDSDYAPDSDFDAEFNDNEWPHFHAPAYRWHKGPEPPYRLPIMEALLSEQDHLVRLFIERGATLDAKLATDIIAEAEPDVRPSILKWMVLLEKKGRIVDW